MLGSCWIFSVPAIQHEPRDLSRRAWRDAFELFDNVSATRLHSGNVVQHLDELARPIRFVSKELGKQLDVVQPFGELVLPSAAGLCLRVNACIRPDSVFS